MSNNNGKRNWSYPCNDRIKISGKAMNRAFFLFCSYPDDDIPSKALNYPGQQDTISGEELSLEIIREYNLEVNRQVNHNVDEHIVPLSDAEKLERQKLRKTLAEEYAMEHGYFPRKGILDELVRRKEPRNYVHSAEWVFEKCLKSEDKDETEGIRLSDDLDYADRSEDGCLSGGSDDDGQNGDGHNGMIEEDLDAGIYSDEDESGLGFTVVGRRDEARVLEFAAQFTGRRRAVLDMLIAKSNGEKTRGVPKLIARKWGTSTMSITRDVQAIGEAFLAWLKEEHE